MNSNVRLSVVTCRTRSFLSAFGHVIIGLLKIAITLIRWNIVGENGPLLNFSVLSKRYLCPYAFNAHGGRLCLQVIPAGVDRFCCHLSRTLSGTGGKRGLHRGRRRLHITLLPGPWSRINHWNDALCSISHVPAGTSPAD